MALLRLNSRYGGQLYALKAAVPRGFAVLSHFHRWRPDWPAGVGGFELPEDDLPNSQSTAEEGAQDVSTFLRIRQTFQSSDQTTFAGSNPVSPATESGLVLVFFVVGRQRNGRPKSERNFRFFEPAELRRDERKRLFSRSDFAWKGNLRGCESIVDCCPVGFEVFKNDIVPFNLQLV